MRALKPWPGLMVSGIAIPSILALAMAAKAAVRAVESFMAAGIQLRSEVRIFDLRLLDAAVRLDIHVLKQTYLSSKGPYLYYSVLLIRMAR